MACQHRVDIPTQAVIFAGGRGTRLGELTRHIPKPMLPVAGHPFLEYLVELLAGQGIKRIVLLLGYRPEPIIEHFGDGSQWDVSIDYVLTPPEVQTLTRLRSAQHLLDDVILTAYCDNYVPLDIAEMWRWFVANDVMAQLTVYANEDGFTRNNVRIDDSGLVVDYDPGRARRGLNKVDIGFAIIDRACLGSLPDQDEPFEHAIYPGLAGRGQLGAYVTHHRYYGVGSTSRLPAAERFFARRPAIILDRDGVLNRRPPKGEYVVHARDFIWLDGVLTALRTLTEAGFTIVIVTNQAGIGRGLMSERQLAAVHRKLIDEAAAAGARIDRIYFCPHHWDDGCACRKPAPGLLYQAQRAFDFDLSRTFFVGDDETDELAARNSGCHYTSVGSHQGLPEAVREVMAKVAPPQ